MGVIDYKKVSLSDLEYQHYLELVKALSDEYNKGEDYFRGIFEVDSDGFIVLIKSDKKVPWAVMFFLQNVMINQRLRFVDDFRKEAKKK